VPHIEAKNAAIENRRLLDHIHLLCYSGAGLEAIASSLCAAIRDLIGADSVSVFWRDEALNPLGFYHDKAPVEIKDIFVTRFEELFSSPDEINMISMTRVEGPSIGKLLDPDMLQQFQSENVFRYLCTPLGHHYLLDARIEVHGVGRALLCLWNPQGRPFTAHDAKALEPVQAAMEVALGVPRPTLRWISKFDRPGHMIMDLTGQRMVTINSVAENMLMNSNLLKQNLSLVDRPRQVPGFVSQLAGMLTHLDRASLNLPVTDGRIVAQASHTQFVGADGTDSPHLFVSLDLQAAFDVMIIDYLRGLLITPLQRKIALFAMTGGLRADCEREFGISAEAAKKHVRAVCNATDCQSWQDLKTLAEALVH
jgi:hypothetical protein